MISDALGYRAKIGIVVPATNTIVQPECEAMRPAGVTNHVGRMPPSGRQNLVTDMDAYQRSLEPRLEPIAAAVGSLLPCEPSAIVLGHSINSFWGGVNGARHMAAALSEHALGTPVVVPALAMLSALSAIVPQAHRVAILTPYFPPGDQLVCDFFEDAGFSVCAVTGLRCTHPLDIASRGEAELLLKLSELSRSGPDVIVQPGTNLAAASVAARAERQLGLPVIACNTACYWHCLRALGIRDQIGGFGILLEHH